MNTPNLTIIEPADQKTHKIVAWCLLGGLLFLRLPFLTGIVMFSKPDWLTPFFEICTYLLTAILIYWESSHLSDYHIDALVLIIIIFFKPLNSVILAFWHFSNNPLALPNWPGFILLLIAVGLSVALLKKRKTLPKFSITSLKWFGIGLIVAFLFEVIIAYPGSLTLDETQILQMKSTLFGSQGIIVLFFYQLGFAAVSEEPLFRGFLWGFLRQSGWKNVWIWLFQAGLFMLGHLYFLKLSPLSFWLTPIFALVFGALVWRSKTIASSMAAHALINGLSVTTWIIAAQLFK